MWTINRFCTIVADAVYGVLSAAPAWFTLTLLSVLLGVAALVVMRYLSNQDAIGRIKDDIKANMLAMKLYKDELAVTFRAVVRVNFGALKLLWYMLQPMAVMIVPLMLMAAQMAVRYEWRPLHVGETGLLTVRLKGDAPADGYDLAVTTPAGVEAFDRVRIPAKNEVVWRVRADRPGRHQLAVVAGQVEYAKELAVGNEAGRVSPRRPRATVWQAYLYPLEKPFGDRSLVQSISVNFPPRDSWFAGSAWWIVWFLILSIVTALILKPVFRVKF